MVREGQLPGPGRGVAGGAAAGGGGRGAPAGIPVPSVAPLAPYIAAAAAEAAGPAPAREPAGLHGPAGPAVRAPEMGMPQTVAPVDFDAFYAAERRLLVRFVMFLGCPDAGMAEDVAQEAFIRAFRAWGSIRSPRAWLRTVAGREYAGRAQKAARQVPLEAAAGAEGRAAVAAAVALEQQADTREVLTAGIAALPVKQRLVMAWHWDGFSDAEIARELGDSVVAVRKNRSRATARLRQLLAPVEGDGR